MLVDKERVREYYQMLKDEMVNLCHVNSEYVELWVKKVKNLQLVGAWYHYMILIRKAKEYVKKECPCYYHRFLSFLRKRF